MGRASENQPPREAEAGEVPGVIFDLDGTLADTLDDLTASVNVALKALQLPPQPRDQVRGFVGDGLPVLMQRAAGREDDDTVQGLVRAFRDHYGAHYLDRTRLYPGIGEALEKLAGAGCPLAVLSNKPEDFTRRMCAKLLAPFDLVAVMGDHPDRPRKPDPTAALELAELMQRHPDRVLLVGDSTTDVDTAKRAGMTSVAVAWGLRSKEVLAASGPDHLIDEPGELPALLSSLFGVVFA